jgi:hypothetical protein
MKPFATYIACYCIGGFHMLATCIGSEIDSPLTALVAWAAATTALIVLLRASGVTAGACGGDA